MTHNSGLGIVGKLRNSTSIAQQYGKEFIMFETNSASCGGFRGISNVYGISLWGLDYGLQMAYSNFTGALLHIGGQDVSYNVSLRCTFLRCGELTSALLALHPYVCDRSDS